MKQLKNLLIGCLLAVVVIVFDHYAFHRESKMRKFVVWIIIVALLILAVRLVSAQAFQPIRQQQECVPVAVGWTEDSTSIKSFGCALFKGDTLVLVHHIVGDRGGAYTLIMRQQVRELYRLVVKPPTPP